MRGNVPTVLDEYDYRFEIGKAAELRPGRDVGRGVARVGLPGT